MISYRATHWYWMLPGISDEVFSSETAGMVSLNDAGYVSFLAGGNLPSRLNPSLTPAEAFAELYEVLTAQAPSVAVAVRDAWTKAGYLTSNVGKTDAVA